MQWRLQLCYQRLLQWRKKCWCTTSQYKIKFLLVQKIPYLKITERNTPTLTFCFNTLSSQQCGQRLPLLHSKARQPQGHHPRSVNCMTQGGSVFESPAPKGPRPDNFPPNPIIFEASPEETRDEFLPLWHLGDLFILPSFSHSPKPSNTFKAQKHFKEEKKDHHKTRHLELTTLNSLAWTAAVH